MLTKNYSEGLVWFSLRGDINLVDVADFLREMQKEVATGSKGFILDLSDAEHIHRHAFDSLINIKNKLRANGVRLVILCTKKMLIDILSVERVPEHFEVTNDPSKVRVGLSYSKSLSSYRN